MGGSPSVVEEYFRPRQGQNLEFVVNGVMMKEIENHLKHTGNDIGEKLLHLYAVIEIPF